MGSILVIIALAVVLAILLAGLFVMAMGGEMSKQWSNRLMRYRIIAQAIAVVIVILVIYFSAQH